MHTSYLITCTLILHIGSVAFNGNFLNKISVRLDSKLEGVNIIQFLLLPNINTFKSDSKNSFS